jgi:cell division protein FtsB
MPRWLVPKTRSTKWYGYHEVLHCMMWSRFPVKQHQFGGVGTFSFTKRPASSRIAQRITEDAMSVGRDLKRRGRVLLAPTIFLTITGYFGWNAIQGDRGLVAYAQRQELLRRVVAEQTAAKAERDSWETRVSGLRARHLDPDTLDERARAMLNLSDPNEVIVKLGPEEKLF